ncbi:MAG TPA: hypothetical protein VFQ91_04385 [Bryobacteraceae bacterium]|nr:hypothetical protein [Bryobacteraceae bacterium]
MPDPSPISRLLLIGLALLMLGAALPDAELLLQQARTLRMTKQRTSNVRTVWYAQ